MLLDQEVYVRILPINEDHYRKKGYKFTLYETIAVKAEHLPDGSAKHVLIQCDYCGENFYQLFNGYIQRQKNAKLKKDACKKCRHLRQKELKILKYGKQFIKQQYINHQEYKKLKYNIKESQLEEMVINNLNNLEKGLKFLDHQVTIYDGRIDILTRDKNGILCIIELKVVDNCKDLIWQCAYYPTQFNEKTRIIAICPNYREKILKSLHNLKNVELYTYDLEDESTIIFNKI